LASTGARAAKSGSTRAASSCGLAPALSARRSATSRRKSRQAPSSCSPSSPPWSDAKVAFLHGLYAWHCCCLPRNQLGFRARHMKPDITKLLLALLLTAAGVCLLVHLLREDRTPQLSSPINFYVTVNCQHATPLLPEASPTSSINWKSWAEGLFWLATFAGRLLS
jgi:hypothetical protein